MPATDSRAWVRLPSGKRLDLLDPTAFDWDDEDLALGLARTYRWGGHSAWPLPLSVAQHSLTVMHVRQHFATHALTPGELLRELLHDADEGLLGFDCVSPLKPFMGPEYAALTKRLEQVVQFRYNLKSWTVQEHKEHKRADRVAAASEAVYVVGWSESEVRNTLKIRFKPMAEDILHGIYGGTPWEPWAPDIAAARFLAELRRLYSAL